MTQQGPVESHDARLSNVERILRNLSLYCKITEVNVGGFPPIITAEYQDQSRLDTDGQPLKVTITDIAYPMPAFGQDATFYAPPAVGDQGLVFCPTGNPSEKAIWLVSFAHADIDAEGELSWPSMPGAEISEDGVVSAFERNADKYPAATSEFIDPTTLEKTTIGADPTVPTISGRQVDILASSGGETSITNQDITKVRVSPEHVDIINHPRHASDIDGFEYYNVPVIDPTAIQTDSDTGATYAEVTNGRLPIINQNVLRMVRPAAIQSILTVYPGRDRDNNVVTMPVTQPVGVEVFGGGVTRFIDVKGPLTVPVIVNVRWVSTDDKDELVLEKFILQIADIKGNPGNLIVRIFEKEITQQQPKLRLFPVGIHPNLGTIDNETNYRINTRKVLDPITPKVGTNIIDLSTPMILPIGTGRKRDFLLSSYNAPMGYLFSIETQTMDADNNISIITNGRGYNPLGTIPFNARTDKASPNVPGRPSVGTNIPGFGNPGGAPPRTLTVLHNPIDWNLQVNTEDSRELNTRQPWFTRPDHFSPWVRRSVDLPPRVFQFQLDGQWQRSN